jgi:hypothetical protein
LFFFHSQQTKNNCNNISSIYQHISKVQMLAFNGVSFVWQILPEIGGRRQDILPEPAKGNVLFAHDMVHMKHILGAGFNSGTSPGAYHDREDNGCYVAVAII